MDTTVNQSTDSRIIDREQARELALAEDKFRDPEQFLTAERHQRLVDAVLAKEIGPASLATVDPAEMVGERVSVDHDGPGRDQHGEHARGGAPDGWPLDTPPPVEALPLWSRLSRILRGRDVAQISHEEAVKAILAATDAPRYTDRLTLHADDIDVPPTGPRWQILDARDEETWHDVTALVECEDPECTVAADGEVECTVVRSAAFASGFGHFPADAMVDVRIPAGER